jgi:hypothetical protein
MYSTYSFGITNEVINYCTKYNFKCSRTRYLYCIGSLAIPPPGLSLTLCWRCDNAAPLLLLCTAERSVDNDWAQRVCLVELWQMRLRSNFNFSSCSRITLVKNGTNIGPGSTGRTSLRLLCHKHSCPAQQDITLRYTVVIETLASAFSLSSLNPPVKSSVLRVRRVAYPGKCVPTAWTFA